MKKTRSIQQIALVLLAGLFLGTTASAGHLPGNTGVLAKSTTKSGLPGNTGVL